MNDQPMDDIPMDSFEEEDKPFDDTPFDAGVETDEDEDPKKFLQQLAGKMQTSLRKYTSKEGQPDFELEKYIINSIISATHTSQMPDDDKKDIIKKIKDAGEGDENVEKKDDEIDSELNNDNQENEEGIDDSEDLNESDPHFQYSEEKSVWEMNDLLGDEHEQVFDFIMNEVEEDDDYDYSEWSKPMELQQEIQISEGLKYHLDNKLALGESVFRYGSDKFFELIKEVKSLYGKDLINLNENDTFIVNDFDASVKINGELYQLGYIMESEEGMLSGGDIDNLLIQHRGYNKYSVLYMRPEEKLKIANEILNQLNAERYGTNNTEKKDSLNEAEYQGKKVELGKPKRGGSKKFYVYVRNPKTGKVKKVSFGAKAGGGNLAVKLKDPKARKAFADRHNCEQKNDKTKAGYWSCRLPRYAKLLGLSGGGRWW